MKSKLFKKTSLLLLVALLTSQLASCAKQEPIEVNGEDKMKGELSVYYVDYSNQTNGQIYELTALLQDVQNKYPELSIDATAFNSNTELMTRSATELSAGQGPDILLQDHATRLNFNKMVKNGTYQNLSPYIKNDKSFEETNYYAVAMKAGEIDGNQYMLPLGFKFTNLFSTEENLKGYEIDFKNEYTYQDVISVLNQSIEKAKQNDSVIPIALIVNWTDYLPMFLSAFGMPIVDYEKGCSVLDSQMLLELCDFLKIFYPYSTDAFANRDEYLSLSKNYKNTEFYLSNYYNLDRAKYQQCMMEEINEKSVTIMLPKYNDNKKYGASVSYYAAVNGNSKNKQLAYDVSKAMMDHASVKNVGGNLPICKKALYDYFENESGAKSWTMTIDGSDEVIPFTNEYSEQLKNTVEGLSFVVLDNYDVQRIVADGMQPYIEGDTKTFDECYDETVNKLNLYINE